MNCISEVIYELAQTFSHTQNSKKTHVCTGNYWFYINGNVIFERKKLLKNLGCCDIMLMTAVNKRKRINGVKVRHATVTRYTVYSFHWPMAKRIEYEEAHDRLLFGSHETSPIIWFFGQARTGDIVLVKGTQAWDNLDFFYLNPNLIWH